ncbi:hypothetical protein [Pseudonocardia sp. MH-G8]|uniref:hypothetical protein n=1 Tax=Pseudonocardia sp. MH-G8 TaxID=1854588 RepID=UPI000BA0826D|nr:hypothetical protein [Pseudonocardia sp. MH-G8]OZM81958.1 hypothetical protein CFP66_13610 [Pseudonocardia sp. MH-G8]
MSRHRSPSGRSAHPRPVLDAAALPGAQAPRAARHRVGGEFVVRNSVAAAAAAGGVLAAALPTLAASTAPASEAAADSMLVRPVAAVPGGDVRMLTSIVPVAATYEPEPLEVDIADLVKATGLAELRAAAFCDDADLDDLGRVKPWVRAGARFLSCLHDEPELIGVAQRSRDSDHPRGLAIDLMVRGERGDRIAECALSNQEELGVDYVIWEQRYNDGDGWERMSDRGDDTENHFDHVHVSFDGDAPESTPHPERCG